MVLPYFLLCVPANLMDDMSRLFIFVGQDSGAAAVPDVQIMESFFRLSLTLFERRQHMPKPWSAQGGSGGYLDTPVQVRSTNSK